jgi:hypothetical protein
MAIFGGRDQESNKLNDVWLFNFSNYSWIHFYVSDPPIARSGHSACLYKDMMLIFGGIFEVTKELDDMHIFDFKNKRWIIFFEEASSPIKLRKSVNSPEIQSPTSRFKVKGRADSFRIEIGRPTALGGFNSI